MTEKKFTPGPWETDSKDHDQPYLPYKIRPKTNQRQAICIVWQDDAPVPDYNAEQKANAHLIAAAPELFEALSAMLRLHELSDSPDGDVTAMAYAALAKARGES